MKGFTLVELTVTIFVVAILAAIARPIYRGKIDSAKWSEGKATMGTLATALRIYIIAEGENFVPIPTLTDLNLAQDDLTGTFFTGGESGAGYFAWVITNHDPIDFLITATAPPSIGNPPKYTLDAAGTWTATD